MREAHVCASEGFETQARVKINLGGKSIIATLITVSSNLISQGEAGLSEYAWKLLGAKENDYISIEHPLPIKSMLMSDPKFMEIF